MEQQPKLTTRELEVLQAVFDHNGSIENAAMTLAISANTVKSHLHRNIFNKLHVNTLCGAMRAGLALELIDLKLSIEKAPPLFLNSSHALSSAAISSD